MQWTPVSHKHVRRPEEWMAVGLQQRKLRRPQRLRPAAASAQGTVEVVHQLSRRGIVDAPQGVEDRARAGVQQCSRKTQLLVTWSHSRPARFAGAERYELAIKLQLETIKRCQH